MISKGKQWGVFHEMKFWAIFCLCCHATCNVMQYRGWGGGWGVLNQFPPFPCTITFLNFHHSQSTNYVLNIHYDVIKWKYFPCHWPFVRENSPVPVNSPHKGQWRGALMSSLICARINDWVNNRQAGDWRCHCGHYNVNVMIFIFDMCHHSLK